MIGGSSKVAVAVVVVVVVVAAVVLIVRSSSSSQEAVHYCRNTAAKSEPCTVFAVYKETWYLTPATQSAEENAFRSRIEFGSM